MHRAVLTPKRLISNLFALRPYVVKVTPLAGIAAGNPARRLWTQVIHPPRQGLYTAEDDSFPTALKQIARRQCRPPPRAHPAAPGAGIPLPLSLLPLRRRAQGTPRGLDGEILRRGIVPPLGRPSPHRGGPHTPRRGVFRPLSIVSTPCTGSAAGGMVALNDGLPSLAILQAPHQRLWILLERCGADTEAFSLIYCLDVHPLITIPLLLSLRAPSPQCFE